MPHADRALRAAGLRRTPARLAVLRRLEFLGQPCSHAALLSEPGLAEVDDVTLYRTLATLAEAGLVHRVLGTDGVWRYAAQPGGQPGCPGNHAHFLCEGCGGMTCLVHQPMPKVPVPAGVTVRGRHFLVFGRCAACGSGAPAGSVSAADPSTSAS